MLPYLSIGMIYAFAAVVQPGPFLTYLISQSLANGWRRTLPAALSPLVSDVPIVLLVLFVLTNMPLNLQRALQIAGGVFLLYLAWGAFNTWRQKQQARATIVSASHQTVLKAAAVNLLNPNPYLGWTLVMGPLLLQAWRESPALGLTLIAAFYGTMVITLAGIIVLFGAAKTLGPKVNRVLIGISALALTVFGCVQLWLGTKSFILY
jgi:threonine/homoserine/homoserine lactone efflux protein